MQSLAVDMEKEMDKYVVRTFADILQALREHPEWLEELRKVILTSELLELPKKVDELLTRVGRLEEDVAILKQDVAILKQDVGYLKGEVGRLKGKDFERTIREKYYAYFGKVLRKAKLLPFEEIIPILDDAEDKGEITLQQRDAILRLDLLVSGQIRKLRKDVVLAVEVSYSLYPEDLERAFERAQLLATLLEKEVIPTVVACEATEEVEKQADKKGILLIKAEY